MGRRGNGFGTLVSKGEGKAWLAKWSYKGRTYYRSTGTADKRRALKELERLTRPFREEREVDVARALAARVEAAEEKLPEKPRPEMTLDEAEAWLEDSALLRDLAQGTRRVYMGYWYKLRKFLENSRIQRVSELGREEASKFLEEAALGLSPAAWNNALSFWRRTWRALENPASAVPGAWDGVKNRRTSKAAGRRALSPAEITSLALAAKDDPDLSLMVALGVYTGLRMGDCANLKWSSVDLAAGVLTVVPEKTKRHTGAVEIPIHPTLASVLARRPRTSEYVSEENARGYSSGRLRRLLGELFERCGIETSSRDGQGRLSLTCGFHSLRHAFVSMAVNSGMSPLLVQRLVGHSAVDMTAHYFHASSEAMREGVARLPDFSGGVKAETRAEPPEGGALELLKTMFDPSTDRTLADVVRRLAGGPGVVAV